MDLGGVGGGWCAQPEGAGGGVGRGGEHAEELGDSGMRAEFDLGLVLRVKPAVLSC